MKIRLLMVGKTTDRNLAVLVDDYVQRIGRYVDFAVDVIPDLRDARSLSTDEQKQREGAEILKRIGTTDRVFLFDERGTDYSSREFAAWLSGLMLSGQKNVWLVIGGPYGFSDAVYDRANGKISMSRMTFSHQMIRLLITEQVYRALTIINHQPYHHD